jgi:hypothetical protein
MEDLTWFGWAYLVFVVIGLVANIVTIDAPRKPRTPMEAVVYMFTAAFFVWGIFHVGVVH